MGSNSTANSSHAEPVVHAQMDAYTTSMKEKLAHTAQAHQSEIKERNLQKGDVERSIAGEKEKEKRMLHSEF